MTGSGERCGEGPAPPRQSFCAFVRPSVRPSSHFSRVYNGNRHASPNENSLMRRVLEAALDAVSRRRRRPIVSARAVKSRVKSMDWRTRGSLRSKPQRPTDSAEAAAAMRSPSDQLLFRGHQGGVPAAAEASIRLTLARKRFCRMVNSVSSSASSVISAVTTVVNATVPA